MIRLFFVLFCTVQSLTGEYLLVDVLDVVQSGEVIRVKDDLISPVRTNTIQTTDVPVK